jgi:hypothetical protein
MEEREVVSGEVCSSCVHSQAASCASVVASAMSRLVLGVRNMAAGSPPLTPATLYQTVVVVCSKHWVSCHGHTALVDEAVCPSSPASIAVRWCRSPPTFNYVVARFGSWNRQIPNTSKKQ